MKPEQNIKNIIFDFGGVILNIDHELTVKGFTELGVPNMDNAYSHAVQSEFFTGLETGEVSSKEFRNEVRKITGVNMSDIEIDQAMNAMILDFPEKRIRLLEKLNDKYNLFILSNTTSIHYEFYIPFFRNHYGKAFSSLFEKVYWSFQLGMRKPGIEIFIHVLKDSKLNPSETLFIDDSYPNVNGARAAGILAYFLDTGEDITDLFDDDLLFLPEILL